MEKEILAAIEVLRAGGLILYPTDTVWGIGCDATNKEAWAVATFTTALKETINGVPLSLHLPPLIVNIGKVHPL